MARKSRRFLEASEWRAEKEKMNKNKNTVSLDSKAGDVLTPVEVGGGGGLRE